jgi:hypothetical protein
MSLIIFCILFYHRFSKYVFLYLARTDCYFLNTSLFRLYFISVRFKIQSHD